MLRAKIAMSLSKPIVGRDPEREMKVSTSAPHPIIAPRPDSLSLLSSTTAMCFGFASAALTTAYLFVGWFVATLGAGCGIIGMMIGLIALFSQRRELGRKMAAAAVSLSGIGIALFIVEMTTNFHLFH